MGIRLKKGRKRWATDGALNCKSKARSPMLTLMAIGLAVR